MLSSSLDALLKLSKTTSPQKLLNYDCLTLDLVVDDVEGEDAEGVLHFLTATAAIPHIVTGRN